MTWIWFYNKSSYVSGRMFLNYWITSHTILSVDDYDNALLSFIKRLGISEDEWNKNKSVTVVLICTLNPFLSHDDDLEGLWEGYINIWKEKIKEIIIWFFS